AVRLDLSQVPFRIALGAIERAAQHGARAAVRQGQLLRQEADVRGSLYENVVDRQQGMILGDARLEVVEELLAVVHPAFGQVVVGAADRDVAVGEPGAADGLEQVEDHLALAERIEEGAEGAEIEPVRPMPTRWLAMRFISAMMTRITCAF